MGSLEQFTKNVIEKVFSESYPHLKLPAIIYATVAEAKQLTDTYQVGDLEITDEEGEHTFKAHCSAYWYEYTLKVLDRFGNIDSTFPEYPGVRSKQQIMKGATVAVGLAFGDEPIILGEAVL